MRRVIPRRVTRLDQGIEIEWDASGHVGLLPARDLRLACPCAECVEEMTGRRRLDPGRIPQDIRPVRVDLVGAYGLRIHWSDGHATGIYPFDRLLAACPCSRCRGGS